MNYKKIGFILFILIIIGAGYYLNTHFDKSGGDNETSSPEPETGVTLSPTGEERENIEIVAEDLEIPWEIAFLPDGRLLVTERPGRLLIIEEDRDVIEVQGVAHVGEGGLMGLAPHPDFEDNNFIYLYLTSREGGTLVNRVERYVLAGNSITGREVILEGIRGAANHDGGRIEFGPDGYLYITTGDAQNTDSSQDTNSLNGKILRVMDDGSIPEDNPFGNEVYSYGHRNVQGISWDDEKRLWATEHGRSGIRSGFDELNLIVLGGNYGWPDIQGDEQREGMIAPVIHSGANSTWAPSGAAYLNGSIFFAGLRGATLYEAQLNNERVSRLIQHLQDEYGRLRAVKVGPEGDLYITTSNRDGRGNPRSGDDKIIRINPDIFN